MATGVVPKAIAYPTRDGRPMAETDHHRDLMVGAIQTIQLAHGHDPQFYVSGNLLVFYEQGNPRKHVAPDFFVVRGVPNDRRDHYLIWAEGRAPEVVIEFTSKTTRKEDQQTKLALYRDTLKVKEYFLFDPFGDYLKPRFQGYRLRGGRYVAIRPVQGRLPSQVLGVYLEAQGEWLRFYDPSLGRFLLTPEEARQQAEAARQQAEAARQQAEAENQRLRRELEELRGRLPAPS
jgi:Uma2 family endonuclease